MCYNVCMKRMTLCLLLALLVVPPFAQAQQKQMYSIPSRYQMERACEVTQGQWRALPDYCNDMHPGTWVDLDEKQRKACYSLFHEPCECGPGRRFTLQPQLGCVKSRFQSDIWG